MNVLYVTSEVAPFAKTGGLADVSAALPRALHGRGHDVRVFVPLYAGAGAPGRSFAPVERLRGIEARLGGRSFTFSVLTSPLPGAPLPIWFVHCPELYGRPGVYTRDPDEHLRFLLLSYASLLACQRLGFSPDVVHCHDWQTALVPLVLKTELAWDRLFARSRTLLTIHNLQFQGLFPAAVLPDTGLARSAHLFHQEQLRAGAINFLLTGILYADGVSTVSPTYAREIQTEEQGAGLDGFLRARRSTVVGILNGIDGEVWNPATDRLIPHRYSPERLAPKALDRAALLEAIGLPRRPGRPVAGIVSRLAAQKGFELVLEALPAFLARGALQLVVLGRGGPRIEAGFSRLQAAFPAGVCFYRGFSDELAHLIEAGADLFLMPSRYEPCGMNQMYSLRYGTVPVVRRTGGLADTVRPWNRRAGEGTGFVFEHHDARGLAWALGQALGAYRDPRAWRRLMRNGMAEDFSAERQARSYEDLYARLAA